jgi:hypothetical protein
MEAGRAAAPLWPVAGLAALAATALASSTAEGAPPWVATMAAAVVAAAPAAAALGAAVLVGHAWLQVSKHG